MRAVRAAIAWQEFRSNDRSAPAAPIDSGRVAKAKRILASSPDGLSEHDSKRLLALYGIPVGKEKVASTAAAAAAAAEAIGFPVAVKAHGASLQHKSEHDGVRLNLRNAREVRAAFKAVTASAGTSEALIARMIPPGTELILGLARDPQLGLMVVAGIGGIFVEIIKDVQVCLPPFGPGDAERMLSELRGAALLDGARGRPQVDRRHVVRALTGLSQLAIELGDAIDQVDINPLIAGPRGAWAADALVIPRRGEAT